MTRIGKNQLRLLITLASPTMMLMTGGKEAVAMASRGLLQERRQGNGVGYSISSSGLRALADEMEAGRVDDAIERMKAGAAKIAKVGGES